MPARIQRTAGTLIVHVEAHAANAISIELRDEREVSAIQGRDLRLAACLARDHHGRVDQSLGRDGVPIVSC